MIYTNRINTNYFTGFQELVNSQIRWQDRVLSVFKIFSYFTVVIPAIVGVYYIIDKINSEIKIISNISRLKLILPKEIETFSNEFEKSEKGRIHLPTLDTIINGDIKELHQSFTRNINILVGLFASVPFENFSFHGTDDRGIRGIAKTKQSGVSKGDFIWAAGVDHKLDPITTLADYFTAFFKADGYNAKGTSKNGGLYIFRTKKDEGLGKYIHSDEYTRDFCATAISCDSHAQKCFLNLIQRNDSEKQRSPRGGNCFYDVFSVDKNIDLADEMRVKFNPDNFNEKAVGVILNKDRRYTYNIEDFLVSKNREEAIARVVLARRFCCEEVLIRALNGLHITTWDQVTLTSYENIGKDLMEQIDRVTTFSLSTIMDFLGSKSLGCYTSPKMKEETMSESA